MRLTPIVLTFVPSRPSKQDRSQPFMTSSVLKRSIMPQGEQAENLSFFPDRSNILCTSKPQKEVALEYSHFWSGMTGKIEYMTPEGIHSSSLSKVRIKPAQGRLGDCWAIAPMRAAIRKGLLDNSVSYDKGEDKIHVRLFRRKRLFGPLEPIIVSVSPKLPIVTATKQLIYATPDEAKIISQGRIFFKGERGGLAAAYIEKAMAKEKSSLFADGYNSLNGGIHGEALEMLTGKKAHYVSCFQKGKLQQAVKEAPARGIGCVGTLPVFPNTQIGKTLYPRHVYSILRVEGSSVIVENPWGVHFSDEPSQIRIPLEEVHRYFGFMSWVDIPKSST